MHRLAWTPAFIFLLACGSPRETAPAAPSPVPEEEQSARPEVVAPRFGGALVQLGDRTAELVVHETGELHLHLFEGELDRAAVTVTLPDARAGEAHSVAMRWEDDVQGFCGLLSTRPGLGEAEVLLVDAGHLTRATVEVVSLLPEPPHRGSVVQVGQHTVEVLIEEDGDAHAYVLDDPEHRLDVELTLNFAGSDGRLHPLALHWDPEVDHYVGHIEGLHPVAGPLEVILLEEDREALGRGSLLDVGLPRPEALGPDVPTDFQLEMPSLGADVPGAIVVPPASE